MSVGAERGVQDREHYQLLNKNAFMKFGVISVELSCG